MTPSTRSVIIGTAGHIDHGKTTLIRALTGIDTDRLPEEKRRGITIDLGFASMEIPASDGSSLHLSFVDVPGHSLFVHNMLAGAGCVSGVMLVIAADEGIKPQTAEHLEICQLLGIRRGIAVLTKTDAASNQRLSEVSASVKAFLTGTFLDGAPIIPVSARSGDGMRALRAGLLALATQAETANVDSHLRMPIDRSFVMKGFGTVVTGTLMSGALHEGQLLKLEPGGLTVRVRALQTHGRSITVVPAGFRVAVNLAGIDAAEVRRGQTLVLPGTLAPVDTIDVETELLPTAPPLRHRARVHFHALTAATMATVSLYGYQAAPPGSKRLMRLKLAEPIVLAPGDRFVLRQSLPVATIGGGRILDAHPEIRRRKAETQAWLEGVRDLPLAAHLAARVERRRFAGVRADTLAAECGVTEGAVHRHLVPAIADGEIFLVSGDLFLGRTALDEATMLLHNGLQRALQGSNEAAVKRSELRSQTSLPGPAFNLALATLEHSQKVQIYNELISLPSAQSKTAVRDAGHLSSVAQAYVSAGLCAPSVPDLSRRFSLDMPEMRRIISLLQRQKKIVRMGSDDLFMHVDVLNALASRIRELRGEPIDVAEFKKLTGLSRKYAIPLLEYLDRERITRNAGGRRVVV